MKKVYLIAVIVAIIAGVATYMFATEINSKTKFKDAEMVTVLVPAADIEKNVEITADMFEGDNPQIVTKEILAADATDNYVKAQTELVDDAKDVHMITVDKLYANEPINKNRLEDKKKSIAVAKVLSEKKSLKDVEGLVKKSKELLLQKQSRIAAVKKRLMLMESANDYYDYIEYEKELLKVDTALDNRMREDEDITSERVQDIL